MFLISHELHKFSRNKDCKKLFTLHYLTNFHLTVNYFVNILCYEVVNQCSVISLKGKTKCQDLTPYFL